MATREPPVGAQRLSLTEEMSLQVALSTIDQLLQLDYLWSTYLTYGEASLGRLDPSGLLEIARRMSLGIEESALAAIDIRTALDGQSDEVIAAGLDRLNLEAVQATDDLGDSPDTENEETTALIWLRDQVGLKSFVINVCTSIDQQCPEEQQTLQQKRLLLQSGEWPDPDLRLNFKCLLSIAGLGAAGAIAGAGAVATFGLPLIVGLGSLAYVGGLATVCNDSGCAPEKASKPRGRRFRL